MPTTSYDPMNLPSTGLRKFKYRIVRRPLADHKGQEEALNKFAGFGYQLLVTRVEPTEEAKIGGKTVKGLVYFTLQRRTRPIAN